jgi:putative glutamine amidotransferase
VRRPVIGITSYATQAKWGPWDLPAALLPWSYCDALESVGARPVVLPPSLFGITETLDAIDGLILSGGNDIDPGAYGAEPHPETTATQPLRDEAEIALAREAIARDMPVLGVCRGMQIINLAYGGSLEQHLPDRLGSERHRETWGTFSEHAVDVRDGSRLRDILGPNPVVKSSHHQAPDRIGNGLELVGTAEPDGTWEAIEDPTKAFAIGLLWHPEEADDMSIFEALVAAARVYRGA